MPVSDVPSAAATLPGWQVENLRYSRLKICATKHVRISSGLSPKKLLYLAENFDEPINFIRGIVKVKAGSGGRFDAQFAHQGLVAMMTAPQGDTSLIGNRDDIMRMNVV